MTKFRSGEQTNNLASVIFNEISCFVGLFHQDNVDSYVSLALPETLPATSLTSVTKASDAAHQSLLRRLGVADQQQHQNHPDQRNQPRHNHDGIEGCVPVAWRASEKYPISLKATIVPMPAPVPLSPLTEATDSLPNRSEGNTFAMVVKPA